MTQTKTEATEMLTGKGMYKDNQDKYGTMTVVVAEAVPVRAAAQARLREDYHLPFSLPHTQSYGLFGSSKYSINLSSVLNAWALAAGFLSENSF